MAEKNKYDLQYLYNSYKKHYKKVDMDKANQYSDLAQELHGVDLRERYHQEQEGVKKETNEKKRGHQFHQ